MTGATGRVVCFDGWAAENGAPAASIRPAPGNHLPHRGDPGSAGTATEGRHA